MASLLIKNIPDELHELLRKRAARHHRSMNKEVIVLLEQVMEGSRPGAIPEPAPLKRPIDTRTIMRARDEGRR